jgi:hypothetical protein
MKAMARHLACLVHRLLPKGEDNVDRGAAYFEAKRTERVLLRLNRKAAQMGMRVVPAS